MRFCTGRAFTQTLSSSKNRSKIRSSTAGNRKTRSEACFALYDTVLLKVVFNCVSHRLVLKIRAKMITSNGTTEKSLRWFRGQLQLQCDRCRRTLKLQGSCRLRMAMSLEISWQLLKITFAVSVLTLDFAWRCRRGAAGCSSTSSLSVSMKLWDDVGCGHQRLTCVPTSRYCAVYIAVFTPSSLDSNTFAVELNSNTLPEHQRKSKLCPQTTTLLCTLSLLKIVFSNIDVGRNQHKKSISR